MAQHLDFRLKRSWRNSYNELFHSHFEAVIFNMVFFSLGGFALTYLYIWSGELWLLAIASILFISLFFYSLNYSAFAEYQEYSKLGSAFSLLAIITLAALFLPSFGNQFFDAALLFIITGTTVALFLRRKNANLRPVLDRATMVVVLVVPFLLAFGEALFLGFRFWETFPRSPWIYIFIPLMALYGYIEEAIFRGAVQSSLSNVTSGSMAIVLTSLLSAGFMLLWGSVMFAVFTFISATIMGLLYRQTRSLIYVGTVHALQDTWLILALLMVGIIN